MEAYIFPIITSLAGIFFLIRNIIYLRNEEKLKNYIETSPKARRWVEKYGLEKTIKLSKKYFLPIGILIACLLLSAGLWSLVKLI